MSEKKPVLRTFPLVQKLCPVCGKVSYSLSGEHPQCAVARGDAVAKARHRKLLSRKQALAAARSAGKNDK